MNVDLDPRAAVHAALADPARLRIQPPLRRLRPRRGDDVQQAGDLIVTVCDLAHEELGGLADVHRSVPDPVPAGTDSAFDRAFAELARRVGDVALRIRVPSRRSVHR